MTGGEGATRTGGEGGTTGCQGATRGTGATRGGTGATAGEGAMQTYDLSAVTVLIVDPNAFMREILRELLDGLGVGRILTARSLENAADRLREEPRIDMILQPRKKNGQPEQTQ